MPLTKARYLLPVLPLLVLLSVWRLGALAEPQWLPVLRRWLRRGLVALLPLLPLAGLVLAGASVVQVPALPLTPAWGWSSLLLLTALGLLGWRVQRATVDAPGWWRVVGDTALLSCLVLSLAGAVGSPVEQARDGESARAVAEWDRHLPAEVELLCCDVNLAQPCLFSLARHRPLRYLTALPEQAGYRYGDQYSVRAEHVSARPGGGALPPPRVASGGQRKRTGSGLAGCGLESLGGDASETDSKPPACGGGRRQAEEAAALSCPKQRAPRLAYRRARRRLDAFASRVSPVVQSGSVSGSALRFGRFAPSDFCWSSLVHVSCPATPGQRPVAGRRKSAS